MRYQHTGLKNTDSQTSPAQSVSASRIYDAFGNVVSSSGTWTGPFGYAGNFGYQQDASGLKLLGHRYYDPSTGRFLTRDPIKDGRNWYAYGAGEAGPTNIVDPTGLWIFLIPVAKYGAWFVGATLAGFTAAKIAEDLSSLHNSLQNIAGLRKRKSLVASSGAQSFKVLDALRNDQNEVAVQEGRNLIRQSGEVISPLWGGGVAIAPVRKIVIPDDEANPDEATENAEKAYKLIEGIFDTIKRWERL